MRGSLTGILYSTYPDLSRGISVATTPNLMVSDIQRCPNTRRRDSCSHMVLLPELSDQRTTILVERSDSRRIILSVSRKSQVNFQLSFVSSSASSTTPSASGEHVPCCQAVGLSSTIPVCCFPIRRWRESWISIENSDIPTNQEIVPHFLDRHCADPLMRDLQWILLTSVTNYFD